ncbi:hypothetical protein, partial [Salmonella enterica]|uniref:hypothetical protein n=1 Tax=Salmonella enterica TaxID=28901 RepID=UPI003298B958
WSTSPFSSPAAAMLRWSCSGDSRVEAGRENAMTPSAMTVHDNHARRPVFRLLVVLAIVVGLVACARTTVVRETRSAPPRVSTPQPGK